MELSGGICYYTTFTLDPSEVYGKRRVNLLLLGGSLTYGPTLTFLGVKLDGQLTFEAHTHEVRRLMAARRRVLVALASRSTCASGRVLRAAYIATVRAVAE